MGYHLAGFDVTGVDIEPQKHYPFRFVQANALEYLAEHWPEYDVFHASPPCQVHSVLAHLSKGTHLDLIPDTRSALQSSGRPYVIENVAGAPLINPLLLCGSMFGLKVQRHRLFETVPTIWFPPGPCVHHGLATGNVMRRRGIKRTPSLRDDGIEFVSVVGNNYLAAEGRMAMGIDWMTKKELSQAIPPAYTKWIGDILLSYLATTP